MALLGSRFVPFLDNYFEPDSARMAKGSKLLSVRQGPDLSECYYQAPSANPNYWWCYAEPFAKGPGPGPGPGPGAGPPGEPPGLQGPGRGPGDGRGRGSGERPGFPRPPGGGGPPSGGLRQPGKPQQPGGNSPPPSPENSSSSSTSTENRPTPSPEPSLRPSVELTTSIRVSRTAAPTTSLPSPSQPNTTRAPSPTGNLPLVPSLVSTKPPMIVPTSAQSTAVGAPDLAPSETNSSPSSTSSPVAAAAATNQRAVTITVASVVSAAGVLFIIAGFLLYRRYKQRRPPFFHRGITPIDDEEIESWKISREISDEEKSGGSFEKETGLEGSGANGNGANGHTRGSESTSSLKKVPSAVIVYQSTPAQQSQQFASGAGRQSEEFSPRSFHSPLRISKYGAYGSGGRVSIDRDYPQTPIQARAPNAREGLTDESVPGDEPYLPQARRQPSRISKLPAPLSSSSRSMHNRSRSSRSSLRSFGERYSHDQPSPYGGGHTYSEQDLSPRWARASSDLPRGGALQQTQSLQHKLRHSKSSTGHHGHARGHNRVYSNSETPPRVSFSDDFLNSPRPLLLREDIGRAIG
ncbi:uncharacterized protein PgNI_04836 [Pyricularia grisea]|uniref:Uncharacterized protein n=1 Tax=Pyricularia grisea TaxID=148305 RepID=A0A6P8BBT2_PYRGI|nr:uncharacterized protein PgNI_04836 [Pyricularia grisea]TLD13290.1 hypothetical protein PgNI_04836 [Pyricularia grisea]